MHELEAKSLRFLVRCLYACTLISSLHSEQQFEKRVETGRAVYLWGSFAALQIGQQHSLVQLLPRI